MEENFKATFPIKIFPDDVKRFIDNATKILNLPYNYMAGAVLIAISSLLYRFRIKYKGSLHLNFFMALVGKSGSFKSPVLKLVMKPLFDINIQSINTADDAIRQEPTGMQFITTDTTKEAAVDLLAKNGGKLLIVSDEISNFLNGFNRYKSGTEDESFWLSAHSGSPIIVNRKTSRRVITVPNPNVSLIGGIQPEILNQKFNQSRLDSGLTQRFVFILDPEDDQPVLREPGKKSFESYEEGWTNFITKIKDYAEKFSDTDLQLSQEAEETYCKHINFVELHEKESTGTVTFIRKMEGNILKLAAIAHVLRMDETSVIKNDDMLEAIHLSNFFLDTSRYIFQRPIEGASRYGELLAKLKTTFTTQDAKNAIQELGLSVPTMYNWLRALEQLCILRRDSYGNYTKLT